MSRSSKTSICRAALTSIALILLISACGGNEGGGSGGGASGGAIPSGPGELPAEVIEAARAEGKVVYYTSEVEAINEAVAKAFTEKYGVEVEMLRLASSPLTARFSEEKGAGGTQADVLRTADGGIFATEPDWFVELSPELLPQLKQYPEDAYLDNKRSVLTQYSTYSINYNTNLVKEEDLPKTWEDILDPKWSGHILLSDPRQSLSWLAWADAMAKAHGIEFLERFAQTHDFELIDSAGPGAQQVAAGAYWMNFPAFPGHATPVIQQGAPVASVQPTDPTPLKRDHIGLVEGAQHPNAARLFMNFRLSPEALKLSCELNEVAVPIEGIEGCLEVPDDLVTVKDVWTDEEAKPLLDALGLPQS